MTQIYFIRHAESFGNLARRAYGWYDGIVTPKGYEQIKCLEKRFADINIDAVYSSDMKRANETANAIYKPKKIDVKLRKDLREVGFGVWEDMPWGEIPFKYPKAYSDWSDNPLEFDVSGGETYAQVYLRAKKALKEIVAENNGKTVAIVSHGATLRMLMYGITHGDNLVGVEKEDWGDNTCVSLFEFDGENYREIFRNDNSHLSQMPGFSENMRWVREGGGRNAWFRYADLKDDKEKLRKYHREAWIEIFGDEPQSDREVDAKVKRILRSDAANIAFAYCPDGEIGIVELDSEVRLYPNAGHISLLYLNPEFRRRRYGIQLIGHAASKYRDMGKEHISVRVAETNVAAYEFYKKYGFREIFRETEYDVRQIIMILDII